MPNGIQEPKETSAGLTLKPARWRSESILPWSPLLDKPAHRNMQILTMALPLTPPLLVSARVFCMEYNRAFHAGFKQIDLMASDKMRIPFCGTTVQLGKREKHHGCERLQASMCCN